MRDLRPTKGCKFCTTLGEMCAECEILVYGMPESKGRLVTPPTVGWTPDVCFWCGNIPEHCVCATEEFQARCGKEAPDA